MPIPRDQSPQRRRKHDGGCGRHHQGQASCGRQVLDDLPCNQRQQPAGDREEAKLHLASWNAPPETSRAKHEHAQTKRSHVREKKPDLQGDPGRVPGVQRQLQQIERRVRDGIPEQRLVAEQHDCDDDAGEQLAAHVHRAPSTAGCGFTTTPRVHAPRFARVQQQHDDRDRGAGSEDEIERRGEQRSEQGRCVRRPRKHTRVGPVGGCGREQRESGGHDACRDQQHGKRIRSRCAQTVPPVEQRRGEHEQRDRDDDQHHRPCGPTPSLACGRQIGGGNARGEEPLGRWGLARRTSRRRRRAARLRRAVGSRPARVASGCETRLRQRPGDCSFQSRSLQSRAAAARRRSCRHGRRHSRAAVRRRGADPARPAPGTTLRAPADDRQRAPTDGQPTRAVFHRGRTRSRRHQPGRRLRRLRRRESAGGEPPPCRRLPPPARARGRQRPRPCREAVATSRRRSSAPLPRPAPGPRPRRGRRPRAACPTRRPAPGARRSGQQRQSGPASATARGARTRRRARDARRHCRLGIWARGTYH